MRLYTSGVKVPKLYSLQDRVLRQFQLIETRKNIQHAKLLSQIAIGSGAGDKNWFNNINNIWNDYLNLECGTVEEIRDREQDMATEYEKYRYLRPKLTIGADGSLTLTGINKE